MAPRNLDGSSAMTSFVSEMLSVIAERGRNLVTWPGSENSLATREGKVCICTTSGGYSTDFIFVQQFSQ